MIKKTAMFHHYPVFRSSFIILNTELAFIVQGESPRGRKERKLIEWNESYENADEINREVLKCMWTEKVERLIVHRSSATKPSCYLSFRGSSFCYFKISIKNPTTDQLMEFLAPDFKPRNCNRGALEVSLPSSTFPSLIVFMAH